MKTNKYVTVTRSGDTFIYKHQNSKEETPVSQHSVYLMAQSLADLNERTQAGLYFLRDALEAMAETGKDVSQYQLQGAAALCWSLSDSIGYEFMEHPECLGVIEKLAAEEVK